VVRNFNNSETKIKQQHSSIIISDELFGFLFLSFFPSYFPLYVITEQSHCAEGLGLGFFP
jgi:hypothetical protein